MNVAKFVETSVLPVLKKAQADESSIEDQIIRLGLQAYYEVQKAEIIGRRTQTQSIGFEFRFIDFIQGSQQAL